MTHRQTQPSANTSAPTPNITDISTSSSTPTNHSSLPTPSSSQSEGWLPSLPRKGSNILVLGAVSYQRGTSRCGSSPHDHIAALWYKRYRSRLYTFGSSRHDSVDPERHISGLLTSSFHPFHAARTFHHPHKYQIVYDNTVKISEQDRTRLYCGEVLYSGQNCLRFLQYILTELCEPDGAIILLDTAVMRSIFYMNPTLCRELHIYVAIIDISSHLYYFTALDLPNVKSLDFSTCLMVRSSSFPYPASHNDWLVEPLDPPTPPKTSSTTVILTNSLQPTLSVSGNPAFPPDYDLTGLGKHWYKKLFLGTPPRCSCAKFCSLQTCSNALQRIECDDRCKNQCMNKRFQTQTLRRIRICDSGYLPRGRYLTTSLPLFRDQFVGTYKGRVIIPAGTFGRQSSSHRFLLTSCRGTRVFLDAKWNADDPMAALRYINHSCLPTGRFELWNVLGYYRIGYFMNEDVKADEELTADYRMVVHEESDQVPCSCPLQPPHMFPRLDSSRCQKILCPTNVNALVNSSTIDITDLDPSPLKPSTRSSPEKPSPTSQPVPSSERSAASGTLPPDVNVGT